MKQMNRKPARHIRIALLAATALCATSGISYSAENASSSSDRVSRMMDEVVVTARKREEGLQSTPIAVSAFTGDSLEYRGVTKVDEIALFTPNLTFSNNPSFGGASNSASIYIRGIGQKEFLPTTEPGVGLYVDGVYIARSVGGILDLIDIERVEVLRGPQGTLFGRNTIGGALSITTRKPDEILSARASATYGTDDRIELKGSVNIPVTDTLFAKFSAAKLQQDGYLIRDDGIDLGDDDTLTGRAALRWLASDNFEVNLSVEGTKDRENGPAVQLTDINLGNTLDPDTPPFAVIHNVGANLMAGGGPVPCANPGMINNPAVPGCYDYRYVRGNGTDAGTSPAFSNTDLWAVNLSMDWDVSDTIQLKSITSFRDLEGEFARDGDHSPFEIAEYYDELNQEQFTQEFQLLGNSFDGKFNWIVGLYYFQEKGNNENILNFTISRFRSGGSFDNTSYAAFAQGTYDITPRFHLTLGGRYTDESKKFTPDQVILENKFAGSGDPLLDAPFMQAGQRILPFLEKEVSISEFTPMANLSYDVTDDLMTYVSYSEGFKSGGFTQRVFPPIVAPFTAPPGTADIDLIPTFDPEFVKVYEAGFKYATPNNRFRLNGAIFRTEYDDLQIQVFTSVAPVTKNAASATITGFELEMQAMPVANLFVEAGLGYLDAKYKDIDQATTFIDPDSEFERVPEWALSAGISYEVLLGEMGSLTPRVDWAYKSKIYNDAFNSPEIAQDGYHLVNANIAWTSADEDIGVVVGIKNLTDEEYRVTGINGDAMQAIESLFDRGRQWYVTLKAGF